MPRARLALALACTAVATAVAAPPAGAVDPAPSRGPAGPDAAFDIRFAGRPAPGPRPVPARTRAARARLTDRLGPALTLDVDPRTGTARALQDLDGGALSGPAAGDRAEVARRFARANADALGLDAGDVSALEAPERVTGPAGSLLLRFGQSAGGVPVIGAELRVLVDRDGRVLTVGGAPIPDLRAPASRARLDAADALRRVGATGPVRGDDARLVLFAADRVRLAWRVTHEASPAEVLDAMVDAETGELLRRVNLVKSEAPADVLEHHPGEVSGGTMRRVDLEARGYLPSGAATLTGPRAEAYMDPTGDNRTFTLVTRTADGFVFPFTRFTGANSGCTDESHCTWNWEVPTSWQENRDHATVQAFYAVNRFADHLRSPAIGFTDAEGAFGGNDPVRVETEDGAANGPGNNANMYTPRDGSKPRMQLYLFGGSGARTRDVDSAYDSEVIFHEYTHGLSSRLVTDADGVQALNSAHAGALGEGWSDWFAQDLLVREGHVPDGAADGEVRLGTYFSVPGTGRRQALDCPVGAPAGACPGSSAAGSGGFTFGDFGKAGGSVEVHYDGEIWGETLWDLRTALVRRLGSQAAGSDAAEALVTGGMRLTPPEPSFLDARNAILAADAAAGGTYRDLLWDVFTRRGMGFFAAVEDSADTVPVEDFSPPPDPSAPRGEVAGRVIDEVSGLPLPGVSVAFGGHTSTLAARTGEDGTYRIADVPAGRYPKVLVRGLPGHDPVVDGPVEVAGAATTALDFRLRRNWAARAAGARKVSSTNEPYDDHDCGADELIDERRDTSWLAANATTYNSWRQAATVVELPQAIDVRAFGMDPRAGCRVGRSASTRDFRLETSPDGTDGSWSVALEGSFADADAGRLNVREPAGGARGVRFVRLTLLKPFDETPGRDGNTWIGISELEVYGAPPNALPAGPLSATPARVAPGETVRLDASGVRDPDSAITGYDWDLDGDGRAERTTAGPTTDIAYPAPGRPAPRVFARDFRGGAGSASAEVEVVAPPSPPPAPPATGGVLGQTKRALARPALTVASRGTRGRIAVRATCATGCTITGRLTAGTRTLGRLGIRLSKAGTRRASLALPSRTRARLRRLGGRPVRLTARVTVRDALGRSKTVTRRVSLRL